MENTSGNRTRVLIRDWLELAADGALLDEPTLILTKIKAIEGEVVGLIRSNSTVVQPQPGIPAGRPVGHDEFPLAGSNDNHQGR